MSLDYTALDDYISENVVKRFYENRIERLQGYKLKRDILRRKNPYLFKAKNINTSETFVRSALDAFLSSQEETMFGNLLEELAIYICSQVYQGKKAEQGVMGSIDLEFVKNNTYYVVGIKSGIYWGNRDQIARMKSNFKTAKKWLRENGVTLPIVAVNGCMYGKDNRPYKEDKRDPEMNYYKYCGQTFWEFISGDPNLYVTIIRPLDIEAKKRHSTFIELYEAKVEEMSAEFRSEFIENNRINWAKLIELVSKNDGRALSEPNRDGLLEE